MRYVRQQRVITTVCDEEITDMDTVRSLMDQLAKSDAYVSISYNDPQSGYTRNHENVRVRSLKDDKLGIQIHNKTSTFNVHNIPLDHILSVKLVSDSNNIVVANDKITRFDLLDIGEEIEPK